MKWNPAASLKNIGYGWIRAGVSKGKCAIQVDNRMTGDDEPIKVSVSGRLYDFLHDLLASEVPIAEIR